MGRGFAIAGIVFVLSCGGGGTPASPTVTTPTSPLQPASLAVLTVTGGDTGRPIAGAQVVVAGVSFTTDSLGQARPSGGVNGASVDIIAPGYLDRQTLARAGSESTARFTLWPREPVTLFNEDYTKTLVYTSSTIGMEGATDTLRRLPTRTTQIRVVLPVELSSDSTSAFFHQYAADNMNTAVSGLFRYTVGSDSVAGSLNVPVSVNPSSATCLTGDYAAYASVGANNLGEITTISITYCAMRYARDGHVVLHEMGHTLGLRHSTVRSDVMYPGTAPDVFSSREVLLMKLMYQRPPGNAFPDNDRATTGLASESLQTIACVR